MTLPTTTEHRLLAVPHAPEETSRTAAPARPAEPKGEPPVAAQLVSLAQRMYRFFSGTDGKPYAVALGGSAVALPLRGPGGVRERLARAYFAKTRKPPSGSALTDALAVIEGLALEGVPEPVGLRVARDSAGIVIDLGDETGKVVVVEPNQWRVTDRSPVLFRRTKLTAPIPIPTRPEPGQMLSVIEQLHGLINVDQDEFRLIVGWMLAALLPDIPHPILALAGEQGTAKTTALTFLLQLIDPSPAPVRSVPRDPKNWAVAATASWTVGLDNLSGSPPPWLSDALCRAVTGDAMIERALYTDDDVTIFALRRVVAFTSIDSGTRAGDLAERLLPVELQVINAGARRTEADVCAAFEAIRPAVFGALIELLAAVLKALPQVRLDELPRMADFTTLLAALDSVTGWATCKAYLSRTAENSHAVLASDPFAEAIMHLVDAHPEGWRGTAAQLLHDVATPDHPPRSWPKTTQQVSNHLKRITPALRTEDITVASGRTGRNRWITIHSSGSRKYSEYGVTGVTGVTLDTVSAGQPPIWPGDEESQAG